MGELTKVRIKPRHFHEVVVYLPYRVGYNASTVFEARDVGEGWLLYGKVFHKKVFDIVEEEDMSRSEIVDKGSVGNKDQPFPIGSKVRRLNCSFQKLQVGEEYTVKGYSDFSHRNPHIFVEEHNIPAADCSNFELVEDKPKSEWFRYKYRVTPESSKLLQEAVFADGGGWGFNGRTKVQHVGNEYLYVNQYGELHYGNSYCDFQSDYRVEKEPPKVETKALQDDKVRVQSDLHYDSSGKWVVPREYAGVDLNTLDLTKFVINQQEEVNMSNNTQRKTVTVNLIDRDSALDEKFALVATFGEFTTSKSPEALIRSIIIDPKNKVAELITQHNEVRVKQTNKEVLERTGNKVTLEAVEESDLHWEIR